MRHQRQQISLPNWESDARATQASLHTRALDMPCSTDLLPIGKGDWEWGILKQPFYTTCDKVCIDKRGLTELMEPLWFWRACLFYSTSCTGFWRVLDAETASLNQLSLYQSFRGTASLLDSSIWSRVVHVWGREELKEDARLYKSKDHVISIILFQHLAHKNLTCRELNQCLMIEMSEFEGEEEEQVLGDKG